MVRALAFGCLAVLSRFVERPRSSRTRCAAAALLLVYAPGTASALDARPAPVVPGSPVPQLTPPSPAKTAPAPPPAPATSERLLAEDVLPARVHAIDVRASGGLWATQRYVILRELVFGAGDLVSQTAWDASNRRLWNTQLFTNVESWFERRGDALVAVFDLTERWTLIPALEARYGGSATWVITGLTEHNLLGRYVGVDALYEYFDGVHGGQLGFRDPRVFGKRLELRAMAGRAMRPRPSFVVQRAIASASLHALANDDRLRVGATVEAFHDDFLNPIDTPPEPLAAASGALPPGMQTARIAPSIRVGRVDARRIQYDGETLEVKPHLAATLREGVLHPFGGVVTELLGFRTAWRFTFAARARAAVQTRTAGEQLDYWLGGLDTIRGFRDNFVRANSYVLGSAEVRFVVFDTDWLACEVAVFADASGSHAPRAPRTGTLSAGPGLRFFIPRFVASELRIDFPYVIAGGPRRFDVAIGTEPFF